MGTIEQPGRAPRPGAAIPMGSVHNLRDLGGWSAGSTTRVRRGLVYRSAGLDQLAGGDVAEFLGLGIRRVFDLRALAERDMAPDRVPAGVDHVALDILADAPRAGPAQLLSVLDDPDAATKMLGGGRAIKIFCDGYREMVHLPSARLGYRQLISEIARADSDAALFHCTTGKARTGWAAASLLTLLGVSQADVMDDYLLTNDQLVPALQPVLDGFAARGGDPAELLPVIGVRPEYLEAAFDEMRTRFGSIDGYANNGLGLDAETIGRLRDLLLEPTP